jgi:hypothetical protein
MKGANLQDVTKVNLQPLNRISKVWLEKAGVAPDPKTLHALELINWALGERAIQVNSDEDPLIAVQTEETLQEMETKWHPAYAMDFLAKGGNGDSRINPDELEQAGSPVDAALKLLGCLTNAIVAKRPLN